MARKGRAPGHIWFRFRRDSVISTYPNETISAAREAFRKQLTATVGASERTRWDHVGIRTEPHLPRISQACPFRHDGNTGRKAMTEAVTAFLVFISIGIFLAHAFDAYRLR
jgi:hypothetical protein